MTEDHTITHPHPYMTAMMCMGGVAHRRLQALPCSPSPIVCCRRLVFLCCRTHVCRERRHIPQFSKPQTTTKYTNYTLIVHIVEFPACCWPKWVLVRGVESTRRDFMSEDRSTGRGFFALLEGSYQCTILTNIPLDSIYFMTVPR